MKDHAPAGTIELCGEWKDGTGEHRVPMALSGNAGLKRVGFRIDSSMARNEIGDGALGIRVQVAMWSAAAPTGSRLTRWRVGSRASGRPYPRCGR